MSRKTIGVLTTAGVVFVGSWTAVSARSPQQPSPATAAVSAETPIGSGPFKAIMEVDRGLATHTVYRPADLAALGSTKMPIVAWGNGACANAGNAFREHLSEVASHGFLVIAVGTLAPTAPRATAPPAPVPSTAGAARGAAAAGAPRVLPPPATHTVQLIEAIDWAIAENSRQGSSYRGKLDTTKVAVMGQSCGGVQAIEASADPRVTTSGIWNSGLLPQPTDMAGGKTMSKDDLARIHAPILYVTGDETDVAYPNANDDFERINHVPVFRAYEKGIGHGGTHRLPNGGDFGTVSVAWLKWQLRGDREAAKMFQGAQCGLCTDVKWVVSKKRID